LRLDGALWHDGASHIAETKSDPSARNLVAVNIYREVLKIAPNDPDCYANLGTSFMKMYHREKSPTWTRMAKEAWEQSLVLNPAQPRVREYLESCQPDQ
jgi:hypothetical protein